MLVVLCGFYFSLVSFRGAHFGAAFKANVCRRREIYGFSNRGDAAVLVL